MIKVGVTGGIGSGKTTLCKEWEKLGAYVVYADDLAKQLMTDNKELVQRIKSTFGEHSYLENGELNRSFLAKEAFEKGRVQELNALVHPVLWRAVDQLVAQKEKEGVKVFVKEAAILLQNGRPDNLDAVVIVLASENMRTKRVVERDQSDENAVRHRISKQQDFESLISLSDFHIKNDSTLDDLKLKARSVFDQILKL
ncbi:MAG: dephospho-CoA kinase [Balneola sp.]